MHDARILPAPSPPDALAWLLEDAGGALALVVTRAKGTAMHVAPTPQARILLEDALRKAASAGATRALAWQAEGVVPLGAPVAIVGASAPHRKDALRAVDLLLAGLKGVAVRTDLPAEPGSI